MITGNPADLARDGWRAAIVDSARSRFQSTSGALALPAGFAVAMAVLVCLLGIAVIDYSAGGRPGPRR